VADSSRIRPKPVDALGRVNTTVSMGRHMLARVLVDELHLMIGAGVLRPSAQAFEGQPPGVAAAHRHPHLGTLQPRARRYAAVEPATA